MTACCFSCLYDMRMLKYLLDDCIVKGIRFGEIIKTGQSVYNRIKKRGKILQIILKKRGKRDIVKKGGRNLCIEKTPLS